MEIFRDITSLRNRIKKDKLEGKKIGFVPTMGYLHEGHLSLVQQSKKKADITVVSIYVNPIQFGPNEDLDKYPRDIERDEKLLQDLEVDYLFYPDDSIMYPEGFQTYVEVVNLTDLLCGKSRPGHFRGVTTVVAKLFNIVLPDIAFFGQKDYQQALVIKRMVNDLNFPLEIEVCPIVREHDGLAMSSRNAYLSEEERKIAPNFYKTLQIGMEKARESGNLMEIKSWIIGELEGLAGVKVDYIEFVDANTLEKLDKYRKPILLAGAIFLGKTRLIDNILEK